MLNECLTGLAIDPAGTYLDGTAGGAGHSRQIAPVSYTHLDVYKRQIHSSLQSGAGAGGDVPLAVQQGAVQIQRDQTDGCLLYTSRCV